MTGGVELILQLLQPPYAPASDVRKIKAATLLRRVEVWGEVLSLLRELSFTDSTVADMILGDEQLMVFLFTLLSEVSPAWPYLRV